MIAHVGAGTDAAVGDASRREQSIADLSSVVDLVRDGMTVGVSGFSYQNPPLAVVREIIRRGVRDLTLVSGPTAGIETDLLIGAGCVRRVVTAGVVLERIVGIAPAFRHHAERGDIEVWECDECIWYVALKAAAWGVPWLLWPGGVGSSLPELNDDLEEIVVDGRRFLRVPAIQPDIVFVHAAEADAFGNVRRAREAYLGRSFAEQALAEACAGPVVCTTELIVDNDRVVSGPERTMLHGAIVVEAPRGAHPGGVTGRYGPDLDDLKEYAQAGAALRTGDDTAYRTYLERVVGEPDRDRTLCPQDRPAKLERGPTSLLDGVAPAVAELMLCVVARELRDDQVVAFGLDAGAMLAAAMLAQSLHAPNLHIRHGLRAERGLVEGSAAWTANAEDDSWCRIEYLESHDAILRAANPASPMRLCDVFFVGGLQIDREGSTNLIGLRGDDGRTRIRGPGSIGTTSIGTLAPDVILFSTEHSPRRFVEQVDFVSVPGWERRAAAGLAGGPRLCVTPLAVMDFANGEMRLRSVHSGVGLDEVVEATGFTLPHSGPPATTPEPTDAERAVLQRLARTTSLTR